MTLVVANIGRLYTMQSAPDNPLGVIEDAELHLEGDRVLFAGPRQHAPSITASEILNADGRAVMPGMVDCHTHTLFAGDRAGEFALRSKGATYAQILEAGGGIVNTMRAVRAASEDELTDLCADRLMAMARRGVCAVEVKSGYGLDVENELKSLRAIARAKERTGLDVVATCLAAHAVPPEYQGRTDDYVTLVCDEILPAVADANLATFCDVFIEQGAFDLAQGRRVLERAKALGFLLRVHAEQLSWQGGAKLAAELFATSVSHLEFCTDEDIAALKDAGVCVEVLAGAQVFLGMEQRIPGAKFEQAGLTVAVGSDFNPGSAHISDLALCAGLAVTMAGLSAEAALLGITRAGGLALARPELGRLARGTKGHAVVLDAETIWPLVYEWGAPHARQVIVGGRLLRR